MLKIDGVTKRYPRLEHPVLDGVDLEVAEGEFVSLIGPSGCGKTTLLRIVAGLVPVTGGTVYLQGAPSMAPSRDKAVVFQHFNLFPWRTVIGNASYGLEVQGVPKADRLERARRHLTRLGLKEFEQHYPAEISGGMQQRVGIARALAIEPRLLLMDEPFGSLDALTRERLQVQLEGISAEQKLTVLFVTHSIDEAVFLSDRVVVMAKYPTRILQIFDIPMARPRSKSAALRDPRFSQIRGAIWNLLETELGTEQADL